jgi:hypothetical protein
MTTHNYRRFDAKKILESPSVLGGDSLFFFPPLSFRKALLYRTAQEIVDKDADLC